jgi:peptidoglycan DL-endopeptidase CwlO
MTRTRKRTARLLAAALFGVPVLLGSLASSQAAPSSQQKEQEIAAAKQQLDALNHDLEILVEKVNTTQAKLQEVQARLADARATRDAAAADAADARAQLSERAVAAYEGAGSQIDVLLQADDFGDFNDRLQYMGALAQSDADLAARADSAGSRAEWAAQQYAEVSAEQQKLLDQLRNDEASFKAKIDAQTHHVASLQEAYDKWKAAQIAAAKAAERAAAQAASNSGGTIPIVGGNPPPINGSGASAAIAAAKQQIGVPYVWGTMNPGVSFDCSGLTAYAWGRAGVYLPHSSTMQAAATPDVSQSSMQAGDLVFFYSPISHVGLYIGGGQMIDASHSGPGGEVNIRTVYWDNFTVGGRVG